MKTFFLIIISLQLLAGSAFSQENKIRLIIGSGTGPVAGNISDMTSFHNKWCLNLTSGIEYYISERLRIRCLAECSKIGFNKNEYIDSYKGKDRIGNPGDDLAGGSITLTAIMLDAKIYRKKQNHAKVRKYFIGGLGAIRASRDVITYTFVNFSIKNAGGAAYVTDIVNEPLTEISGKTNTKLCLKAGYGFEIDISDTFDAFLEAGLIIRGSGSGVLSSPAAIFPVKIGLQF